MSRNRKRRYMLRHARYAYRCEHLGAYGGQKALVNYWYKLGQRPWWPW